MTGALERSYEYCTRMARRRARNFYYSFLLLPREERRAICSIYAFMRYCDDLSDEPGGGAEQARALIRQWRADLEAALEGSYSEHPVWPAFHEVVRRYDIPREYFFEMIEGVSSDLDRQRFRSFEELYRYCYQVASVAGLSTIHIFGFDSPKALPLAEKCGVAFQLTNILRDIGEDAGRGRLYLPTEDLKRFEVDPEDVLRGRKTEGFVRLMRHEAERARAYYEESMPLVQLVRRRNRPALWALIQIYRRLLERIEHTGFDVLRRRVRLPVYEKSWIVARAALGRSLR